ncbi:MAG: hypothetical protein RLZZ528_1343 [Pseudomonadota bacterium]
MSTPRRIVLSGCSGGGKSTLLDELAQRGYATFPEPGRAVVRAGRHDPATDPLGFALAVIDIARANHQCAPPGLSFHDRSLLDALIWFRRSGTALPAGLADLAETHRYFAKVFLTPPWPEIYVTDPERRHGLPEALAEYDAILATLPDLGYTPVILPKCPVAERADWLMEQLAVLPE